MAPLGGRFAELLRLAYARSDRDSKAVCGKISLRCSDPADNLRDALGVQESRFNEVVAQTGIERVTLYIYAV